MFAQFKHLHSLVHPIPLVTHGHFDLRLPSQHDPSNGFPPLDLLPRPHLQPLLIFFPLQFPLRYCCFQRFYSYSIDIYVCSAPYPSCRDKCPTHTTFDWRLFYFFHSCIVCVFLPWNHWNLQILKKQYTSESIYF